MWFYWIRRRVLYGTIANFWHHKGGKRHVKVELGKGGCKVLGLENIARWIWGPIYSSIMGQVTHPQTP
jgi:hypothetical protein